MHPNPSSETSRVPSFRVFISSPSHFVPDYIWLAPKVARCALFTVAQSDEIVAYCSGYAKISVYFMGARFIFGGVYLGTGKCLQKRTCVTSPGFPNCCSSSRKGLAKSWGIRRNG